MVAIFRVTRDRPGIGLVAGDEIRCYPSDDSDARFIVTAGVRELPRDLFWRQPPILFDLHPLNEEARLMLAALDAFAVPLTHGPTDPQGE